MHSLHPLFKPVPDMLIRHHAKVAGFEEDTSKLFVERVVLLDVISLSQSQSPKLLPILWMSVAGQDSVVIIAVMLPPGDLIMH
ncbi:hypothetical protein Tco_0497206 [Tanacetum coccineum]